MNVAESEWCMRQCCEESRGFVLHITDNYNQVCGLLIVPYVSETP